MTSADLIVRNCRQLLTCGGPIPKRKAALGDVGLIKNGWIASLDGKIVFAGREKEFRKEVKAKRDCRWVDGSGLVGLPGFVDPHTHLPFAGNREGEFALRLKGYSYTQLAEMGLGIQTTVKATRRATEDELIALCLGRLDQMLLHGTTTCEAKSGYGLNLKDEIKQLKALREVGKIHPVDVISTFMGAHEIPAEYKARKNEYIDLLIGKVLPEVKKKGLADFFDIFCERGVFSLADTKKLVKAAQKAGFDIKVHSDEFVPLGGTEFAAEAGAVSAEHLINITETGIQKLSRSRTAAVLLPAVSFFLMLEKKAPARELIDSGAVVALATDFNPGSSMTESMLFVLQLAVYSLRLTIEEAINASTANAAYAIRMDKEAGSLEPGKKMDLVLWHVPAYTTLVYHLGINPVRHVIKNGKMVVKDGIKI